MSVADPVIDHLDLLTKRIYLLAGTRTYHPVTDLYAEVRYLRRTDDTLRGFDMPLTAVGNVAKGGGKFTPRYVVFQDGWRVVPEDTSHTLEIVGEQLTAEGGAGPDAMDLTLLSPSSKIAIAYEPPSAEIIEVATAGGLAPGDIAAIASAAGSAFWQRIMENGRSAEWFFRLIVAESTGERIYDPETGITEIMSNDGQKVRLRGSVVGRDRSVTFRDGSP